MGTESPFERACVHESHRFVLVRRAVLAFAAIFVTLGLISACRAWFQVKSLRLTVPATTLTSGSTLVTDVVSYARGPVDVRIELVQGAHVETLGEQRVPGNWDAGLDPRTRSASQTVTLTPEILARFTPGPAIVRATAIGRPQWLRTPSPLVREVAVEIVVKPLGGSEGGR